MAERPLSDLVKITHGFAFPGENFTDEPTSDLLLTPGNFAIGGGFQIGKGKYYRGSVPPEYVLPAGELVVTMTDLSKASDTLGYPAIVPDLLGIRVLHNQRVGRVVFKDHNAISKRFLYYLMCSREYRHEILASATGTGVKHTAPVRIEAFKFDFPPLPEQRAIAGVLGALDDKIEVNRKTARVLEGIARAVFTSWFVDFDPVRRAAAGQPTGLPRDLAALFPTRVVDSPIGEVPEGWRVLSLPEVFEVNPTRSLKKGAAAPYLDMSNMPTQGHAPAEWVQREAGSGMRFVNGDTLVARITPCLENGKTAFVDFLADGEVAWGSTEYIVLRPKPPLPPVFAYLLARDERFRTHAIQAMTGSSGRQRVPAESLDHFQIAVPSAPSESLMGKFAAVVEPLFARMSMAMQQNRTLAASRDALLPKLISGELRIADAEKIVGRALRGE